MSLQAAGPAMRDAALATTFMVPVCERMGACGPHDRELTPLFECAVMVSMGALPGGTV